MHRFVLQFVSLILAFNGIACACPTVMDGVTQSAHEQHRMAGSDVDPYSAPATEQGCCDNCDESEAVKRTSEQALVPDFRDKSADFHAAIIQSEDLAVAWRSAALCHLFAANSIHSCQNDSPVTLHDRMLD